MPSDAQVRAAVSKGLPYGVAKDIGTLTDLTMTVGAADGTVADVGAAFNQGTLNDNFREMGTKINAINAVLRAMGMANTT